MWNKYPPEVGTFTSAITKFLDFKSPDIKIAGMYKGKLLSGIADKSKTRSGVKYNRLVRLWRRTHPKFFQSFTPEE